MSTPFRVLNSDNVWQSQQRVEFRANHINSKGVNEEHERVMSRFIKESGGV
jgi:hypothetical protein